MARRRWRGRPTGAADRPPPARPGQTLAGAAATLLLIGAAAVAISPPEWPRLRELLGGGTPTGSGAVAVVVLLGWAALGVLALTVVTVTARRLHGRRARPGRSARAVACLVIGAAVLTAGALHHGSGAYRVCCGGGPALVRKTLDLAH